jgi:hypothetical protein
MGIVLVASLGGVHLRRRGREEKIDFQTDQVGRQLGQPGGRLGPAVDKVNVLALDVPVVPQA